MQTVRLSWLWRSECQMHCWAQCPWVFLVSLGVTLDSAETPFAKTPFTWFLKPATFAICFGLLGPFQTMILCPELKQKQPKDRKTSFETLSLPVAKILSPVARQAPTKELPAAGHCAFLRAGHHNHNLRRDKGTSTKTTLSLGPTGRLNGLKND